MHISMDNPLDPMKRLTVSLLAGFFFLSLGATARAASHPWINSYTNATTCLKCHDTAAQEVMDTLHWTWEYTDPKNGKKLGKNNVINSFCIAVASNEPRCTSCHVGLGYADKTFDFSNSAAVDCLVCHDTTGTYKKFPTGSGHPVYGTVPKEFPAGSGVMWAPPDLVEVAKNVGPTSRTTCGACHFYGGGGDAVKHGDLDSTLANPTRDLDVHMGTDGLNQDCSFCHVPKDALGEGHHSFIGSHYTQADTADILSCARCHTEAPHKSNPRLNQHTAKVACQTCHIPAFARGGKATKMSWDWSTAGTMGADGKTFITKDAAGNPIYDTQKGTFTWQANVVPEYVWFNGDVNYVTIDEPFDPAQVLRITALQGSVSDPKARIYPVKRFTGVQPYDAGLKTLAVPHLFPRNTNDFDAYWKTYDWNKALTAGMAYMGKPYSGQFGYVKTEMMWVQNHMVAPKEKALQCAQCHVQEGGRLDFAALGYSAEKVAKLTDAALTKDHTGRFANGYTGSASCLGCHPGKADEVMGSVHYTWRTPNAKLAFPGGGSHGMIDRFCALVGSSAMVNYYADLGAHKGSTACGKCHVGDGLPFPDAATGQFSAAQKNAVDCLVCHASAGNYDMTGDGVYDEQDAEATHRALRTDTQTGRRSWFQDRSLRAAESVGKPVEVAACLRCHEHGQAAPDYKRGTPYKPDHDVHAKAGMRCTQCHEVAGHKMARGSRVSDMHAWERQDVEVDCTRCHGTAPHKAPELAPYNEHTSVIACETCHIPWTSGASRRIWYSTYGVTSGPEASIPKLDPESGVYEPYSIYLSEYNSRPAYRWFNGDVSMLAEPMHDASAWDFRIASGETPGAKIYPFRPIINGMVMDRQGFGYVSNFNAQFTMAAAMEQMATPMKMMGFMRPEGLNEKERAAMTQFPNLLSFDKEWYVHTGNVKEAVSIGLARLGLMMSGKDAWASPATNLIAMGSAMWSGELLGLDLPNNPADPTFDSAADPTQATGSFISLSHAIKRNGALNCRDCHASQSVLNFKALGFTAARAERLQGIFDKVEVLETARTTQGTLRLRWSAKPLRAYQVLATSDLTSGAWTPIGPRVGDVATGSNWWYGVEIPTAELAAKGRVFLRVQEIQP